MRESQHAQHAEIWAVPTQKALKTGACTEPRSSTSDFIIARLKRCRDNRKLSRLKGSCLQVKESDLAKVLVFVYSFISESRPPSLPILTLANVRANPQIASQEPPLTQSYKSRELKSLWEYICYIFQ